jgi:hypothetical protein
MTEGKQYLKSVWKNEHDLGNVNNSSDLGSFPFPYGMTPRQWVICSRSFDEHEANTLSQNSGN